MIIGIDASRASTTQRTGTEAYAYQLISALIPLAAERRHHLRLYYNQPPAADLFGEWEHVEQVVMPQTRLWTHTRLRAELQRRSPDVFFTPAHVIPVAHSGPSVATVHDLGYEFFPQTHTARQRAYLRWSTQHNCRSATMIIADSQATQTDLTRLYGVPVSRIKVVYPGVAPDLTAVVNPALLANAQARYGITPPYLLYLGTLQPRKNLVRLVEAFAASGLAAEGYTLVLAGKPGWLAEPIQSAVAALSESLSQTVLLPGFVDESHKAALLSGATALIFPSLYEGFGFPVLEAQVCGTPVICSNTSSLPEVAGSAALLVNPLDTMALSEAMERIVADQHLRQQLVRDGLKNVTRFTWAQTAESVLAVLENAAK